MRRNIVLLLSATVLLGAILVGGGALVAAQDTTPAAEEELGEGLSFEVLGAGEAEELPETPADIALFRAGFEPGASFEIDPEDPSVALVVIESGVITMTVDAPITVLRATEDNGEPGPEDFEQIPANEEFTMEEGDSAVFPANIGGEVRNDGKEDASALVASIAPIEGEEQATPLVEAEEEIAATPVT